VRLANSAAPANFVEGIITGIASLAITVNADAIGGSGTYSSWTVSAAGVNPLGTVPSTGVTVPYSNGSGVIAFSEVSYQTVYGEVLTRDGSNNVRWEYPNPYRIQVGRETTVSGGGATHASVTVYFPTAFDYTPVVTVTATGSTTPTSVTINNVTTSGFTAYIFAANSSSIWAASAIARTIHWTAIQYGYNSGTS
jgi:hypothetical protein